jgi:hypothetical protein
MPYRYVETVTWHLTRVVSHHDWSSASVEAVLAAYQRSTETELNREKRVIVVPLVLAAGGFPLLSMAVPDAAAVLWIAGVAAAMGAVVVAGRATVEAGGAVASPRSRTITFAVVAGALAFAVGLVVALQGGVSAAAPAEPDALSLNIAEGATIQTVSTPRVINYDRAAKRDAEQRVEDELETVVGNVKTATSQHAKPLIEAAKRAGYAPLSGLEQDFSQATVSQLDGADFVTVPLTGTNLQDVTHVSYVVKDGVTTTVEMVATVTDESHAAFKMWQDGSLVRDVVILDPELASQGERATITSASLNWSKLNSCLTNAGISTWVIATLGAACGVACFFTVGLGCVGCLAAVVGFGSGTIAGCVKVAS